MSVNTERLRIVIIECPYDTWDDGVTSSLISQTIGIKLRGYRAKYDYGVLPVDTTDFISNHQLICRVEDHGLVPLLGCRSITPERCQLHNQPFAGVSLCRAAQAPEHEKRIQELVRDAQAHNRTITYDGSYTIDPALRKDRRLLRTLLEMFTGLYVHFHQEYEIDEFIGGGTIRFNMDRLLEEWGFNPLTNAQGEVLPPIQVASLLGEPVRLMHIREFSKKALEDAAPWKLMWKNRLTIASPAEAQKILKSA